MGESEVKYAMKLRGLAERLDRCSTVTRFDTTEEKEAWSLAHTLLDLDESFRRYVEHLLPALNSAIVTPEQQGEILLDIGEELRHILYHLNDSTFFAYLAVASSEAKVR